MEYAFDDMACYSEVSGVAFRGEKKNEGKFGLNTALPQSRNSAAPICPTPGSRPLPDLGTGLTIRPAHTLSGYKNDRRVCFIEGIKLSLTQNTLFSTSPFTTATIVPFMMHAQFALLVALAAAIVASGVEDGIPFLCLLQPKLELTAGVTNVSAM